MAKQLAVHVNQMSADHLQRRFVEISRLGSPISETLILERRMIEARMSEMGLFCERVKG